MIIGHIFQSTLSRLFSRRPRSNGAQAAAAAPPRPPNLPPTNQPSEHPNPEAAQRWLQLGVTSAVAGQRDKARYCFTQAVRANDSNMRAWLYLAGVAGDPADTLTAAQRALSLDPSNAQARLGYVWARYELGLLPLSGERSTNPLPGRSTPPQGVLPTLPRERTTQPEPAPAISPPHPAFWLQHGVAAASSGNRQYARYCFTRAAEAAIDERRLEDVLRRRRAWLYLAGVADDPALALATLERLLAEEPNNQDALRGIRWAAKRLNIKDYDWRKGWIIML